MNNQDDAGSLERVALPAQGQCRECHGEGLAPLDDFIPCAACDGTGRAGCCGGSDSRSETLSPRIVADLETTLCHILDAEKAHDAGLRYSTFKAIMDAKMSLRETIDSQRRRRPRGESGALSNGGNAT